GIRSILAVLLERVADGDVSLSSVLLVRDGSAQLLHSVPGYSAVLRCSLGASLLSVLNGVLNLLGEVHSWLSACAHDNSAARAEGRRANLRPAEEGTLREHHL
ncbi:hypothetical protein Vafri_8303, partial [Volvox africanus]